MQSLLVVVAWCVLFAIAWPLALTAIVAALSPRWCRDRRRIRPHQDAVLPTGARVGLSRFLIRSATHELTHIRHAIQELERTEVMHFARSRNEATHCCSI